MDIKVLIADDNDLNRWLLAEQLQSLSVVVEQAQDGQEAWSLLQHQPFNLALLDVNMPNMNGRQLLAKIRAHPPLSHLRCVAVTAHALPEMRQCLLSEGFNDYLIKPILISDLNRMLEPFQDPPPTAPDVDVAMLLQKVDGDKHLAQLLLNKLFQQTPEHMNRLQQCLQEKRYPDAWEFAHLLHGTFCFFGFESLREQSRAVEQALQDIIDGNSDTVINGPFQQLRDSLTTLMAKSDRMLEQVN